MSSAGTTIEAQKTVELVDCGVSGVREAKVIEQDTSAIEWDRFMRLSRVAERVNRLGLKDGTIVLDVGGFEGAFALFVPRLRVWVLDPQTTGGSGLNIPFPDRHFEVVVSIDALEHVPRIDRSKLLRELLRATKSVLFVNFPEARSMDAQRLVLSVIANRFIKEHVDYQLPSQEEVVSFLKETSPNSKVTALGHVNIHTWLAWFVLFHTDKERGLIASRFLKKHAHDAPPFLYSLIQCERGDGV